MGNMADQFRSVREIMRGMGVGYLSLHAWVDGRFFFFADPGPFVDGRFGYLTDHRFQ